MEGVLTLFSCLVNAHGKNANKTGDVSVAVKRENFALSVVHKWIFFAASPACIESGRSIENNKLINEEQLALYFRSATIILILVHWTWSPHDSVYVFSLAFIKHIHQPLVFIDDFTLELVFQGVDRLQWLFDAKSEQKWELDSFRALPRNYQRNSICFFIVDLDFDMRYRSNSFCQRISLPWTIKFRVNSSFVCQQMTFLMIFRLFSSLPLQRQQRSMREIRRWRPVKSSLYRLNEQKKEKRRRKGEDDRDLISRMMARTNDDALGRSVCQRLMIVYFSSFLWPQLVGNERMSK